VRGSITDSVDDAADVALVADFIKGGGGIDIDIDR
jgi:hypothetical protein